MRAKATSQQDRFIVSKMSFGKDIQENRLEKKQFRMGKEFSREKKNKTNRYLVRDSYNGEVLGYFHSGSGSIYDATELHYICYSSKGRWYGCFGFNILTMEFESCRNMGKCDVIFEKDNASKIDDRLYQKL